MPLPASCEKRCTRMFGGSLVLLGRAQGKLTGCFDVKTSCLAIPLKVPIGSGLLLGKNDRVSSACSR